MGLIIRTIMENTTLEGDRLKGGSFEEDFKLHVLLSSRLDEGTLARFWGSLNQPVRPAVQAWTAIPILPEKLEAFTRVTARSLEYKDIQNPTKPEKEIGPSPEAGPASPFNRVDQGGGKR
jgi:hypothetical protein